MKTNIFFIDNKFCNQNNNNNNNNNAGFSLLEILITLLLTGLIFTQTQSLFRDNHYSVIQARQYSHKMSNFVQKAVIKSLSESTPLIICPKRQPERETQGSFQCGSNWSNGLKLISQTKKLLFPLLSLSKITQNWHLKFKGFPTPNKIYISPLLNLKGSQGSFYIENNNNPHKLTLKLLRTGELLNI